MWSRLVSNEKLSYILHSSFSNSTLFHWTVSSVLESKLLPFLSWISMTLWFLHFVLCYWLFSLDKVGIQCLSTIFFIIVHSHRGILDFFLISSHEILVPQIYCISAYIHEPIFISLQANLLSLRMNVVYFYSLPFWLNKRTFLFYLIWVICVRVWGVL